MKIKILSVLLLTAAFTAAHAQPLDKPKLNKFFDVLAEHNKAMGTLAIVRDGDVVFTCSIGYAQLDGAQKKPNSAASRFRIGSISKMFTATMIMQLVEERKLNLTDTLDKFYPQVPNSSKITIAHILQHRSGIPNVRREGISSAIPMTKEDHLALIANATPLFEPDTKFSYSNSGFFLLGLILEKVGGQPYDVALQQRINAKAGLKDTYIATGNIDITKDESLTYFLLNNEWKQSGETHPSILFGAGQIISTSHDLAKFASALYGAKLTSEKTLTTMKTIRDDFGLGMEAYNFSGKTFYGHAGGGDNYGAWLAYNPEEKLAIAYCTNAKNYPVADLMKNIADIYYNKPFQIPTFEALAIKTDLLEKYVGTYSYPDAPAKFTITRKGSVLYAQPPGQQGPAALEAVSENKFKIEGAPVTFEFDTAKGEMKIKRPQGERIFTKDK